MRRTKRAALGIVAVLVCGTTMSGATFTASSANPDNEFGAAPSFFLVATMGDPGTPLRGNVSLTASAADSGGAAITSITIQRSPAGAGTWSEVCTDASSPFGCPLDTTPLSDGQYDLRAIATNSYGDTDVSDVVAARHVDNGLPSVTMTDPGTWIPATMTLSSAVSDASGGTGVATVRYEYTPTGGSSWTTACTASSAPFSCTFDTSGLTEGAGYDFRAVATDGASNSATSATIVNRILDKTAPSASITAPAAVLTGAITVSGTASDTGGSGLPSVTFEYRTAGTGSWTEICVDPTSPYSCPFTTSTVADGLYDFRLVATDGAGNTSTSVSTNRRIDNTAPTVSLTDPGAWIRGTVTLTATGNDGTGTGVSSVTFQYRTAGTTNAWANVCAADTTAPYSCAFNTTSTTGSYEFRAVAADGAGFSTTSTVSTSTIDNGVPTATMNDPGSPLTGTVTLSANGTDTLSGVASVRIEIRPTGGSWTTVCSDPTSPYSCPLDTTALADGTYELRSTTTDVAGNTTTSAAVTNRRVDNNPPTVTLNDPGAWMRGTETLSASASDGAGAGVTSVTFQYAPAGTTAWTNACTPDTTAPYTCGLSTTGFADGSAYDLRAIAQDGAGFSTTSNVVADRRVDNSVPTGVVMDDPGSPLTGSVTFTGTAADAHSGVASVAYQYWNGFWWSTLCTATAAPWSCTYNTANLSDGQRDLRALATDLAGNTTASATVQDRIFDNDDPSVTMTDPGANVSGTITLGATASDGSGSGVASVTIQVSPAGAGAWTDVCTDPTSPYSCSFVTTSVADGLYDFRALAVDGVGHTNTSATVANRRVDNTAPSTTLSNPGATVSGNVTLTATATDGGSGIASVAFQRSPAGAGTWTTVCSVTTSPYTCSWDTMTVVDGSYDLRTLATDAAGNVAASALVTSTVDNPPAAFDVQTTNGATAGRADAGDTITFTYNSVMSPASIVSGWDGTGSASVTLRITNSGGNDILTVYNAANTTRLNLTSASGVTLGANYVGKNDATFAATLTRSGTAFTVTLDSLTSGASNTVGTATMTWNPSTAATDVGGAACSATAVTEKGTADTDF